MATRTPHQREASIAAIRRAAGIIMDSNTKTDYDAIMLFKRVYKGQPNFITPNRLLIGWMCSGELAYEVSSGRGMMGDTRYGLTFVQADGTQRSDLSIGASSMAEVDHVREQVRTKFRAITAHNPPR